MTRPIYEILYWPIVAYFSLGMTFSLSAADIAWNNGAGGDWNVAANWNPSQVPGSPDKAILTLGATVTVNSNTTVGSLDFGNGSLTGSGVLTLTGVLNWTGGTMNGSGSTVISNGGSLVLSGSSTKALSQRT